MQDNEEMFRSAFGGSGSIRASCACGREYFEPEGDFDPGELEALKQRASDQPDKVICLDRVSLVSVDGKQFVDGCACKGHMAYARFIWRNRHPIMEYLKARMEQDYELATVAREKVLALVKTAEDTEKTVLPE